MSLKNKKKRKLSEDDEIQITEPSIKRRKLEKENDDDEKKEYPESPKKESSNEKIKKKPMCSACNKKHAILSEECAYPHCFKILIYCEGCKDEHTTQCDHCKGYFCEEDRQLNMCEECNDMICVECPAVICEDCDSYFCTHCGYSCGCDVARGERARGGLLRIFQEAQHARFPF